MVTNNGSPQTTDHDTKMEASRPITTAFRPHKTLLVTLTENTPTWYECGRNTPGRDDTIFSISSPNKGSHQQSAAVINKYRSLANQIYEQEVSLSRHKTGSTTDEQWLEGAIQKGTLKDRIAAMSVLVSSDPVHKLYALDKLLQLAGVTSNTTPSLAGETSVEAEGSKMTSSGHFNVRINQMAAEALVDIFMNTLIPKNRKLYSLDKRPLHMYEPDNTTIHPMNSPTRSLSSRVLLLWRYEEMIKVKYNAFLVQYLGRALSQNAVASLERHKILILGTASNLLAEIPEGENILLAMIVNKLGDPSRKIAAAAGHRLRLVLEAHPNMTTIMAREVRKSQS
jgi:ribosome biogenesis protein MAK21